jgi:hypothetical protein
LSDQRVNAADEQKVVQNQPTSCAGLRAGEIAKLTWPMVLDPSNAIGPVIELHGEAAKKKADGLSQCNEKPDQTAGLLEETTLLLARRYFVDDVFTTVWR